MTNYYVIGTGYTAYGPYTLADARRAAVLLAHKHGGERTIHITGTVETPYSATYDDELPEKPDSDAVWVPWE